MQKTIKFSNTTVIFDEKEWDESSLNNEYAEKLKVDGIVYKYRLYYKTVWANEEKPKLLSFVMLNPSTANQYSNDPSVNNCIGIAQKSGYDGIEVLNIYSLRHPKFDEIKPILEKEGNPDNMNYDFANMENVVLAWGNKKISAEANPKLFEKIKNAPNIFILGLNTENTSNQLRHPGNQGWSKLGGIKNAKLIPIEKENIGGLLAKYIVTKSQQNERKHK